MSLLSYFDTYLHTYVCVCVHMRACVHAHVCVCVYVWYVHLCVSQHAPIMKRCRTPFNKRLHADGAQATAHNHMNVYIYCTQTVHNRPHTTT